MGGVKEIIFQERIGPLHFLNHTGVAFPLFSKFSKIWMYEIKSSESYSSGRGIRKTKAQPSKD